MITISNLDFVKDLRKIHDLVFVSDDPYSEPFQPNIKKKLLLYEFRYGLEKEDPWFLPIMKSIKHLGEDGFYVSLLRRNHQEPSHWYVPLAEAHEYIKEVFPAENTAYSVSGKWGLICSGEYHAIIGGPQDFIQTIYDAVPDWEERDRLFLIKWKEHYENNNIDLNWLPVLLSQVYGLSKCKNLLESNDMQWLIK